MAKPSDSSRASPAAGPLDQDQDLTRTISFSLDTTSAVPSLGPSRTPNTQEELSIPRETIADVIGSSRLHAELVRPIRLGTYNKQPAVLLCFHFSFQRLSESWFTRVRAATITIEFLDAPWDASKGTNPSVADFYPVDYNGSTSYGQVVKSTNATLKVAPLSGGPSLGTGYSHEVTVPLESELHVHGVRTGRPSKNKVVWTVGEDQLKRDGVPREMWMPIIVTSKQPRRFSAKVTVSAHYAIIRGQLANMVPMIGKMDEPLYFDPAALKAAIEEYQTGLDGTPIAQNMGDFNDKSFSLADYCSFRASKD